MANRVTIDALADWLKAHDDYALIGHVSPDGDAVGCCMAMLLALRALGKRAFACIPDGVPQRFAQYVCADEAVMPDGALPFAPKTAFSLDVSEMPRLGAAKVIFENCENTAMVDHHGTNSGFGDVWYVDADAAATGEIVVKLIEKMGVKLTKDMATWLFIAVSTDCGNFNFSNTRPETFLTAARLAETGIDIAKLTGELYRTRTKSRTHLLGTVLAGLETSADGRMAWARLTDAMLAQTGATRDENEGIVNYLLEIEGVEFAALAEERPGGTKLSLRSKEYLDVAKDVALPFGGGGHARAAGCFLEMPMGKALDCVLKQAALKLSTNG